MFAIRGHARTALFSCAKRHVLVQRATYRIAKGASAKTKPPKATAAKEAAAVESTAETEAPVKTKRRRTRDELKAAAAVAAEEKKIVEATRAAKKTAPKPLEKPDLHEAHNDIADKLKSGGVWAGVRGGRRKGVNSDKYRINIVEKKLCDDIIDYIKPTLGRHKGCDLVDIFPGTGLWSKALSDALQPRSHLLLEPDVEFYKPYLEPLLERPGTQLLPVSGIVWEQLNKILNSTYLPHQVERKYSIHETPEHNDTLLVSVNLGMYPRRKFRTFDSLAQLVLYQFIASIRPGSLFQKYGLVRMFIWVEDGEKSPLLPRTIQRRRKMAIEAELSTEYVCEVAGGGSDHPGLTKTNAWFRRDEALDLESTRLALERMRKNGFVMPPGREPEEVHRYKEHVKKQSESGGEATYTVDRPFMHELESLSAAFARGEFKAGSAKFTRMRAVEYLKNSTERRFAQIHELVQDYTAAMNAYTAAVAAGSDQAQIQAALDACQAWVDKVKPLVDATRSEVILQRDNLHILRAQNPILNWDRRYVEPLMVHKEEFFPQVPLTLLDVQPKPIAPVLRDMGPNSTRGGDVFDLVLRGLVQRSVEGVSKSLDVIAAGAGDGIYNHCPSLVDPAAGGTPIRGFGELSSRCLNEKQFVEIAEQWMKWPFRPTYSELVSRTVEDFRDDDDEVTGNVGNQMTSEI